MNKKPSKSVRKFIRKEKARIRREILDFKEQEEKIKELYTIRKPKLKNMVKKDKVNGEKKNISTEVEQKLKPKDKKPTQ